MKYVLLLLISAAAFAGPLEEEVKSVRNAKAKASNEAFEQANLSKHLGILQKKCGKRIRGDGQQGLDIERANCVVIPTNYEMCYAKGYYAKFVDGSIGVAGWDWFGNKPTYQCNLNR